MKISTMAGVAAMNTIVTGAAQAADPTPAEWFSAGRQAVVDTKEFVNSTKIDKKTKM